MPNPIIIVGAGISGCVLAERYANQLGKEVVVVEKRSHIGGNCYDYVDENGIRLSAYGAHLFHTNYEDVWSYVRKFSKWKPYIHKVLSFVDGQLVPVPVNIDTVNKIYKLNINDEVEMKAWLQNVVVKKEILNSEDVALGRVGADLYNKIFKTYTYKQWNKWPSELEPSVLERIPVRTNFDDRYFTDKYQGLPVDGYTKLFEKMLCNPLIKVYLNTDYFDNRSDFKHFEKLFFTGPIDKFFSNLYDPLEYRSLRFDFETLNMNYYQTNSVINYPSLEVPYTRVVEYKHFYPVESEKTVIVKEFSTSSGEPYYPVPSQRNRDLYARYQEVAKSETGVFFVGRLANYKYFNMDQAFKNALDLFGFIEG